MLSFMFFHVKQAFFNFITIKYDELYSLAIIVEKVVFRRGQIAP